MVMMDLLKWRLNHYLEKGNSYEIWAPLLETDRLILKGGTYEDFVKVYEYNFTYLRNIDGEFEFVKYDLERLKELENESDSDYTLDFIMFLKDDNKPINNLVFDRYKS